MQLVAQRLIRLGAAAFGLAGAAFGLAGAGAVCSCISLKERSLDRFIVEPEPEPEVLHDSDGGTLQGVTDPTLAALDPHAVVGITPGSGPFAGGNIALIRGNGFGSDTRVWFGNAPAVHVIPIDASRVQIEVPANAPGSVDVITQQGEDDSTRRVLPEGYVYDAFYVEPSSGPTSGGSLLTITGSGVDWNEHTAVLIDLEPCLIESLTEGAGGLMQITCRTPASNSGSKAVSVVTENASISVPGAFTYTDAIRGFEAGLSGDALDQTLSVWVLDASTEGRLENATVILGHAIETDNMAQTDENGLARFQGDSLGPEVSVTVAAPCMQPVTIVDVPVDTVSLYLHPVQSPDCIPPLGDPVLVAGGFAAPSRRDISGELVWGMGVELKRGGWLNVPFPAHDDELRAAYVFELSPEGSGPFTLPSRLDAVDSLALGSLGYGFTYRTRSRGNLTLYALAGLEDRSVSPRRFTPYVMGIVRGVSTDDEQAHPMIPMDIILDQTLELEVGEPTLTPSGPDQLDVELSLRYGRSGYVLLPKLHQLETLPLRDAIQFVGVPPLSGPLLDAEYAVSLLAATGLEQSPPLSGLRRAITHTGTAADRFDFLEIPELMYPAENDVWDGSKLELSVASGGPEADLVYFQVQAAGGLRTWHILAPGDHNLVALPPLHQRQELGLPTGPLRIVLARAKISNFQYASLRERHLYLNAWSAHAVAESVAHLP